eukprot:3486857-Pyramimonas_sp.AAC.1
MYLGTVVAPIAPAHFQIALGVVIGVAVVQAAPVGGAFGAAARVAIQAHHTRGGSPGGGRTARSHPTELYKKSVSERFALAVMKRSPACPCCSMYMSAAIRALVCGICCASRKRLPWAS